MAGCLACHQRNIKAHAVCENCLAVISSGKESIQKLKDSERLVGQLQKQVFELTAQVKTLEEREKQRMQASVDIAVTAKPRRRME